MTKTFNVNGNIVLDGTALGAMVTDGSFRQVGVIRTQYREVDINDESTITGRSIEAVMECLASDDNFNCGDFYAVEVHRGVAIAAPVNDPEMVDAFVEQLALLDDEQIRLGNGFVYDQEMVTKQEFIG
ncbi:hypothetical protein Atoyac23_39 [Aeromonas phage Atoyac23]|uniref:Uncharacterized protein n=1 Tax=Aeromonas phage Atoyac1 TaxID=2767547 RepID=A0A866D182_9CAUD|nr:hypothetical protein Atoyac1_39 [Aeromonas phage Atoyac1]QOC54357.1 hypothetical protein Atoyac14_39 [Aeromonas phage Atoyac14]QOC54453.1 hypothetical protein Atoyac23_39 [Aeromonas phage Atoyac23]